MCKAVVTKAEVSKKERVNVSLASDLLEALDSEAARRKMDRSALLTEYARTGLNGGVAPAPVVVDVPTAKEIADELTPLLSGTVGASVTGGAIDLTALIGKLDDHQAKLKLILREALTHSEMMIDDIAARYITQQHGCKLAVAVDAAEDAYAAAQAKAEKAMGITR